MCCLDTIQCAAAVVKWCPGENVGRRITGKEMDGMGENEKVTEKVQRH